MSSIERRVAKISLARAKFGQFYRTTCHSYRPSPVPGAEFQVPGVRRARALAHTNC